MLSVLSLALLFPVASSAAILTVDCDGQSDFTDINPALEAAQNGDVVLVRECSTMPFSYSPFSIDLKFDVHVIAGDRTAIDGVGSMPIGVGIPVASFRPLVTIRGPGTCIAVNNSTRIVIKGFELSLCGGDGLVLSGSTDVGILGNRITGAGGDGLRDEGSNGSYIHGNLIGLSARSGVRLINSTNLRLADNMIGFNGDATGGLGVDVGPSTPIADALLLETVVAEAAGGSLANTIINNLFIENPGGCILDAGFDTKIESNTCSGATDTPRTIFIDMNAAGGEVTSNIGIIDDPFTNSDQSDNCPVSAPC